MAAEGCGVREKVHARALLSELASRAAAAMVAGGGDSAAVPAEPTLDDVPDSFFSRTQRDGYDAVYLLGVWATGEAGIAMSQRHLEELGAAASLESKDIIVSSPFAVVGYEVAEVLGGEAALSGFRRRLADHGIALILDFVPNHVAVDHPWVKDRPEFLMQGNAEMLAKEPQNYIEFAHGRDPYFDGWRDTIQLNYDSCALRDEMQRLLLHIADKCDGVRCDMAMLVTNEIFDRTWGKTIEAAGLTGSYERIDDSTEFWTTTVSTIKSASPGFVFVAEVYWDMEYALQCQGFDFTYDKQLYDRMKRCDARAVQAHLRAAPDFASKSVRFLENHDEPRATATFGSERRGGLPALAAAAAVAFTVPGMRFVHAGQDVGRREQMSMHVRSTAAEEGDAGVAVLHRRLLEVLRRPDVRRGHWAQCKTTPSMDGNDSWHSLVAHGWTLVEADSCVEATLVIVNFSKNASNGHVRLPDLLLTHAAVVGCRVPAARGSGAGQRLRFLLRDLLSEAFYDRDVDELRERGLWVSLAPWQSHVFEVTALPVS